MHQLAVTSRKNTTSELVNVCVFDDTAEATLTLWGCTASSAALWKASSTVLLISNPGWRIDHRAWISLTSDTCVEVDPCISDADWLRGFAQGLTKREHVSPPFPEEGMPILTYPTLRPFGCGITSERCSCHTRCTFDCT